MEKGRKTITSDSKKIIVVGKILFTTLLFAEIQKDTTFQPQDGNARLSVRCADNPFPFYIFKNILIRSLNKVTTAIFSPKRFPYGKQQLAYCFTNNT